jgi:hypothetical protein
LIFGTSSSCLWRTDLPGGYTHPTELGDLGESSPEETETLCVGSLYLEEVLARDLNFVSTSLLTCISRSVGGREEARLGPATRVCEMLSLLEEGAFKG